MQLTLVINRHTTKDYYANKSSTLIPIKPPGLIVHGLCFLGVNVFAIECIILTRRTAMQCNKMRLTNILFQEGGVGAYLESPRDLETGNKNRFP